MAERAESSGADRRENERVEVRTEVAMMAVTDLMAGAGADLSTGGMYVVTPHDLPTGSLVDLEFELGSEDRKFRAVGEIRWRHSQPVGEEERWGLGIEFVHAMPEDREALREFVEAKRETGSREFASGEAPGRERRESERVPVSARVKIKTVANLTAALAADVSAGGMRVRPLREFAVGRLVDLEFAVAGLDRVFRLLGEIKWRGVVPSDPSDRREHGIEFIDVGPREREILESFVRERRRAEPS